MNISEIDRDKTAQIYNGLGPGRPKVRDGPILLFIAHLTAKARITFLALSN